MPTVSCVMRLVARHQRVALSPRRSMSTAPLSITLLTKIMASSHTHTHTHTQTDTRPYTHTHTHAHTHTHTHSYQGGGGGGGAPAAFMPHTRAAGSVPTPPPPRPPTTTNERHTPPEQPPPPPASFFSLLLLLLPAARRPAAPPPPPPPPATPPHRHDDGRHDVKSMNVGVVMSASRSFMFMFRLLPFTNERLPTFACTEPSSNDETRPRRR